MRKWLIISGILHAVVMLLLWLGLPHLTREVPEPPQIIPIDIAQISDITATKVKDKPEPQKKPEIKPEPPKPEPPKPVEKPPEPKPQPATPPPSEANAQKKEAKPEVKEVKKPEPAPTAETIDKPKEKKPEPKKEPKKEEPKSDPLASVLKNVAKLKTQAEKEEKKEKPEKEAPPASSTPSSPLTAEHLSISEEDALRRQIMQCWNVPVGAKDIDKTVVEIVITVNPDRTLKDAMVADQARLSRDPFFRAVAESAIRALQNPRCNPLALPADKYQQWKEILFTFNPRDMF
jgi:outer membrane biosynthesis protein TonB